MIGLKFPDSERFWLIAEMASGEGDLPLLTSISQILCQLYEKASPFLNAIVWNSLAFLEQVE